MKKTAILLLAFALAAGASAGTYTWTGAAGDIDMPIIIPVR